MLCVFQYEINNDVFTLEAFCSGGTTVSGANLWPQIRLHGGSVILEGWVVVNLSLEMLDIHTHLLQKLEIFKKVVIEKLLNALEAARHSNWKPFQNQPHNMLNAFELNLADLEIFGYNEKVRDVWRVHIWKDRWIPRPNSSKVINPQKAQYKEEWVSNLIHTERRCWNVAKVVQRCLKEGKTGPDSGSSSDNSKMKAIWKMVWQLECPSKIKCFMWKACKNILPTRNRLKLRGVDYGDCCALCGDSETLGHILWDCTFAKEVWSGSKMKLPALPGPVNEFLNVVWVVVEVCPNIIWVLFAVTAWSLWNNRNTVTHGGRSKDKEGLIKSVASFVAGIKEEKTMQRRGYSVATQIWSHSKQDWYKVNTDGAVFRESGSCGIGVVIKNEKGQIMGALCRRLEILLGALEVEAKAVEEGVQFARDLCLNQIVVESDSLGVVNSLHNPGMTQSSICKVVEGTRLGLRWFKAWEVAHTRRGCNTAAHILVRNAKFVHDSVIWVEDTPPMIVDQVINDVNCMVSNSV
ncbi:uncharacterized protein LOC142609204 [Castanea sativa]|uniref:uncharacterized protein LOC142609204 n=1 Tax=Castanea sativa TaxID=21020 RepID=UPI003F64FB12